MSSVESCPPPESEPVLLHGYYGPNAKAASDYPDRIAVGCFEEGEYYIPHFHCDVEREITHWTPLPAEPEKTPCPDCGGSGYVPDGFGSGEPCGCNAD